ncbi:(E)-4-hydroxy-3-methylbut-2-enyl-diphosphate synthase [Amycolatopsis xylanica]|uniref:(E)-4-hydroxy-3-methylbut-2-enyl-diphosphate synthase n=1 Tax=Amycolatopsis xylanica TaxID=589385 RepID=A0A1H3GZH1_9PSEU|nr:flavodoxin-dependent (E)-4-hydroxy-3-methylbut-2-enyl-diphosphate synthase [Amycolatopsis xylanica]SDY08641.1 (E)-4-hydroxy-3-methylbut-2-enyl-diphosphate synthase [Amycolatopsis xylanica]
MTAALRRASRQVMVGGLPVGGGAPVAVQAKVISSAEALGQIETLADAGCALVRVAVSSADGAGALPSIVAGSPLPVVADAGFQRWRLLSALDASCAAVRVNPGDIEEFAETVEGLVTAGIPVHVGVTARALDWRLVAEYGRATPEALAEAAAQTCALFEAHDFRDLTVSVHHTDPLVMASAYRQLARRVDYPLHLEVAGDATTAARRRQLRLVFGFLLKEGIGDSVRVSLSGSPVEEVRAAQRILAELHVT